ncbi:hypothetical protein Bca4012_017741 [Brassica carinata]
MKSTTKYHLTTGKSPVAVYFNDIPPEPSESQLQFGIKRPFSFGIHRSRDLNQEVPHDGAHASCGLILKILLMAGD